MIFFKAKRRITKKTNALYALMVLFSFSFLQVPNAQDVPELMYFKFNSISAGETPNEANPTTRLGAATATVTGLTIGGTGQFGTGLQGNAGPTASNHVDPKWTTTYSGDWTISLWINVPTPPTTRYFFGNSSGGGTFRCFTGGVANNGLRLTGGTPTFTLDIPSIIPGPVVITYVYNSTAGTITAYKNGVFETSGTAPTNFTITGTNFRVGSQGTSIDGIMDEFRFYNRALTATEINLTWNEELPLANSPNNAGISALTAPDNFCAGTEDIKVMVRNFGNNRIDSVKVGWEINGVAQPHVSVNTPLDTTGGTGINELEVTLGTHTFTSAATDIKAWTYQPNGVADTVNGNDTISKTLQASLSGQYTVNATMPTGGTNYESFADLINDFNTYGVCGPVIVDVAPNSGPYNETLSFGDIAGTSTTNYIRINGNGNVVEFANTSSDRQLLVLDGTKHLRIDNLNFKALATGYGWGALITGGAEYDSITNSTFDLSAVTSISSANVNGIVFSNSTTSATTVGVNGSYCYIADNHILGADGTGGPYYGITISGDGNSDNIIEGNNVENYYYYGIRLNASPRTIIRNNEVHKTNKTASFSINYGIYTTGEIPGLEITENKIHHPAGASSSTSTFYGIRVNSSPSSDPMLIANNLIYHTNQGGAVYGIYLTAANAGRVYHNTIDISELLTSSSINYGIYSTGSASELQVKNNLVSITGGGTGTKYGFYYNTLASVGDAQMNNFYVNSTQGGTNNYGYFATAYLTQADFQVAHPLFEIGSPNVDPLFEDPDLVNFRPGAPELAGVGEDVFASVPTDIRGGTRTTTPTIGAFEVSPDDIGVSYIYLDSDSLHCSGKNDIFARVRNFGSNAVDSFEVNWTVDGILQQPLYYDSAQLYVGDSIDLYLGVVKLFHNTNVAITAWTNNPNGVIDMQQFNDTFSTGFEAALSGFDLDIDPGDTTICRDRIIVLNAGSYNNNPLYIWNTGDTTSTITVEDEGTYFVGIWSEDGCFASDTVKIEVAPYPEGESIGVVEQGNTLIFTALKDKYVDEYIWNFGDGEGTRNGGVTESHNFEENGLYTVSVTLRNSCGDLVLSRQVFVENAVGIAGLDKIDKDIVVYPNPARNEFTIKSKEQEVAIESYEIYNILGQKVVQEKVNRIASEITVNTSSFASGIYHIKLQTDKGTAVKKVEILK